MLDADVKFKYVAAHRPNARSELGPALIQIVVSNEAYAQAGAASMLSVLQEVMSMLDAHQPISAVVDCAPPEETFAGLSFVYLSSIGAPLARQVEKHSWLNSGWSHGDRIFGLYWGNYLNERTLIRLGGRNSFLERFRTVTTNPHGVPLALTWEFENGVLVTIGKDPERVGDPFNQALGTGADVDFALWLKKEFTLAGILNHW